MDDLTKLLTDPIAIQRELRRIVESVEDMGDVDGDAEVNKLITVLGMCLVCNPYNINGGGEEMIRGLGYLKSLLYVAYLRGRKDAKGETELSELLRDVHFGTKENK